MTTPPSGPSGPSQPSPARQPTRAELYHRHFSPSVIVAVLALTGTVASLQQTLVVPVLPELPSLLHISTDDASWAVTATLLMSAVATPIVSRAADMYGKRKMLLLCLVVQVLGSAVAALTTSLAGLVVGRALQGFAAGLIPVGISIMRDTLPRERVGGAVALMSATLGVGSAVGLPLSGVIYAHTDWHMLFWASAAMAVIMIVVIMAVIPESRVRAPGRFDHVGSVILSVALVCLLLGISKGGSWGWTSEQTLLCFVGCAVALAAFVPWELRTQSPTVDLRTAAKKPVLLTNIASLALGFAMYGNMLSTTSLLQLPTATGFGFGLDVLASGLCMLPGGLAMVVLSPMSARITSRYGGRVTLIVGALILALGYLLRVLLIGEVWQVILGASVVSGGVAIAYAAMPTLIMGAVPISETASANGVNSLVRAIGTSSSSAVVAALLTATTITLAGVQLPALDAFKHIFWVCMAGALFAAFVAAFIPRGERVEQRVAPAADAPELVLRGRVHSGSQHPVRNAVISLLTLDGEQVDWGRVEPDGSYTLVVPGPGRYVRIASADGWAPRTRIVALDEGTSGIVDLGERLQLRGIVTDAAGQPAPGILVTLTRLSGERMSATQTGADGRFALPLAEHGRHVVSAVDTQTGDSTAQSVTLTGVDRELELPRRVTPRVSERAS